MCLRKKHIKPMTMNQAESSLKKPTENVKALMAKVQAYIQNAECAREHQIRYSLRDGWTADFDQWLAANRQNKTFSQLIVATIQMHGMSSVDFYKTADLDRKLFSKMYNDPHYQPSKRTAIACCLALRMDIHQTEHVLKLAGFALSHTLHEDLAVRYCIEHSIFNVFDVLEVVDRIIAGTSTGTII